MATDLPTGENAGSQLLPGSLQPGTGMRRLAATLPVILFAATLCFGLGLVLPIAVFESFFVFSERPSLVEILAGLWDDDDRLIALVVGLFSIAFPAAKLIVLHMAAYTPERLHWVERLGVLSKWSMADVLIVALAIFAAKTSGLAEAATRPGSGFMRPRPCCRPLPPSS